MKRGRDHGDLIALAITVSVCLHALVMFFAAPRVMSRTGLAEFEARRERRPPMSVKRYTADPFAERARTRPRADVPALKAAPSAENVGGAPDAPVGSAEPTAPAVTMPEVMTAPGVVAELPPPMAVESIAPSMKAPAGFELSSSPALPEVAAVSAPSVQDSRLFEPGLPAPAPVFELVHPKEEAGTVMAALAAQKSASKSDYVFNNQVLDAVDETLVEKEKTAVRELISAPDAIPVAQVADCKLADFVDPSEPGWRYFQITFSPKRGADALPVVPKDVVIIIDASGSIGSDRLIRCRNAAKSILRSCMNSGDRFNLVAFRNRFSYAFRQWRECDASSFAAADGWLSNLAAHGRTDVFSTIRSVLALPRDPVRPVIALVVTDGDANEGVSETAEILSRFTALNDGLISVYMYGVKKEANRKLIDLLTRGNRGESFVHTGSRRRSGAELEPLAQSFRDPVLTDLRVQFSAGSSAEVYPRLLKNLYRGGTVEIVGRCPIAVKKLIFTLRGLAGAQAYESLYNVSFDRAVEASERLPSRWREEKGVAALLFR